MFHNRQGIPRAPKVPQPSARAGVSGYNKPKRTPNHPRSSPMLLCFREGDKIKTIRLASRASAGRREERARADPLRPRGANRSRRRRNGACEEHRKGQDFGALLGGSRQVVILWRRRFGNWRQQIVKPRKGRGSYSRKDKHDGIR